MQINAAKAPRLSLKQSACDSATAPDGFRAIDSISNKAAFGLYQGIKQYCLQSWNSADRILSVTGEHFGQFCP